MAHRRTHIELTGASLAIARLVAALLMAASSVLIWDRIGSVAIHGTLTEGEVVDFERDRDHDPQKRSERAVVWFEDVSGAEIRARHAIASSVRSAEIGSRIAVRYDPEDPTRVIVGSPVPALLLTAAPAAVAALLLLSMMLDALRGPRPAEADPSTIGGKRDDG